MKREDLTDASCGIAQALGVVGDWWTLLVVREIAGGVTRFDALQRSLGISRRALTERLGGARRPRRAGAGGVLRAPAPLRLRAHRARARG